jgi:hypothetical protein
MENGKGSLQVGLSPAGGIGFPSSTQSTKIKHLTRYNFKGRNPTNRLDEFSLTGKNHVSIDIIL